jgi:DNA-binding response OmpR family regulator
MKKVLILEDESSIRSFVVINLKRVGYTPIEADTAERAFIQMRQNPDIRVALLDIMLPDEGIDGFEVCRRLRAADENLGIIMLTARSQEMDKVMGLMTGADDYITKPFSPAELTARIDALYRRLGGEADGEKSALVFPPFKLNLHDTTFTKRDVRVRLTQVELSIIKLFMENPGKAISREEIYRSVWGNDDGTDLKIVDVNIRRIRIKIEDDPQNPTYITTVWGYGYRWGA